MPTAPKNVFLGISGGIAAYKTPELVRRLRERSAEVQIVLTHSAREFVTETSLQAVSGRPIRSNIWDKEAEAAMGHIELARWADLIFIAPATAEIISRLASGSAPLRRPAPKSTTRTTVSSPSCFARCSSKASPAPSTACA